MPTFYKLSKNSINFVNHYSFTSGGGSTFNSEFMINTGYSTAYNYNMNAYSFSKMPILTVYQTYLKKKDTHQTYFTWTQQNTTQEELTINHLVITNIMD